MMITDMFSNKKLQPKITELFITTRKINIFTVFTAEFPFAIPKKY